MITLILLMKRKRGMSKEQFRHHYETSHVALAKKYLGHLFFDYRRHYVKTTSGLADDGVTMAKKMDGAYDAITNIVFRDKDALDEFMRICSLPDVNSILSADEERFLDRPAMLVSICEEVKTWTATDLKQAQPL
ncbi:EthD domain-containing protein [Thermodesulfobacteriota bacterium]